VAIPLLAVVSIVALTFLGSSAEESFTSPAGPTSVPVATAPPGTEATIDAFSIRVGDCIDDPGVGEVQDISVIPCAEPHDDEAYALFDVDLSVFDAPAIDTQGADGCHARFEEYVGASYETSSLEITFLFPLEEGFDRGDREVVCLVYDGELAKLEGTVKGSGL
jgi:hypothetical protein